MTIHWKAVVLYFTVVLFVDPLIPRVTPLYFTVNFTKFVSLKNLSVLELALSGTKGLTLL